MNNYSGEIFFISRFNQTSLKETWNKKVLQLWNLLNFIDLTSKLLVQKKSRVTFRENIVRRKEMWLRPCDTDTYFRNIIHVYHRLF